MSATKDCRSYTFDVRLTGGKFRFCLIDVPGMLDTQGRDVDSANIDAIARFLFSEELKLHAICIVLKDGENRLDPME